MDESKKAARHARWEQLGVKRVKSDLQAGGHRLVGGSPEVRTEAWAWVKAKESEAKEIFTLKPAAWGMGVDLKAAWRRAKAWFSRR